MFGPEPGLQQFAVGISSNLISKCNIRESVRDPLARISLELPEYLFGYVGVIKAMSCLLFKLLTI